MSADTVDLLHGAEDRVVQLERLLGRVADAFAGDVPDLNGLVADIRTAIEPPYCRESCSGDSDVIHDEDCGCPCHRSRD